MLAALHKSRRRIRIEVDVDTMCGLAPKPAFMRLFDLPSSHGRTLCDDASWYPTGRLTSIAVAQVEAGAENRGLQSPGRMHRRTHPGFRSNSSGIPHLRR